MHLLYMCRAPPLTHVSETFATLFFRFAFAVSASLMYGYYGDSRLLLGPSSSRLVKANSVLVDRIEVTSEYSNDLLLYGFHEKPELSSQANWSTSKFLDVSAYSRKVTNIVLSFT